MKKIILVSMMVLLIGGGFSLFATGTTDGDGTLIGIAMPETHVERWRKDGEELKKQAMARGYKAEVAFADADQSKQNKQIEDFITKGAKLIIVGSIDAGAAEAVSKAKADGVIIIAYDRLITGSDAYDYYVTFDNFKVGQIQGQALADALDLSSGKEAIITYFAGSPTDNNAFFFFDGAVDILNPFVKSGALTVVGPNPMSSKDSSFTKITTEGWKAEIAKKRMETLLVSDASGVTLDAVLAPNDPIARAVIEALRTDAKYATTLPVVTGQDGEVASIKMIMEGQQYMTVFKDTRNLAAATIEVADALLKGETPNVPGIRLDESAYDTGMKTVKSYLLEPVEVTKSNYKEVMIDSGYYTEDQIMK